jgi:membrane-bound lytic murein transglycosylase F
MGHLEDARVITQKQEGDPNKWNEVKTNLPLLSETEWYTKTKNGYARGLEPVLFVNSVRTYFDVLLKTDEEEQKNKKSQVFNLKTPAI